LQIFLRINCIKKFEEIKKDEDNNSKIFQFSSIFIKEKFDEIFVEIMKI
jgi:hypothetical protein